MLAGVGDTRRKLIDGALDAIRVHGIAGASARNIASAAGVNQALVFYHFGSVDDLLAQACREATAERVAHYRDRLAAVGSLRELLDLGRTLHAEERAQGNVAVLAQLLAGAQTDDKLAGPTAEALGLWVAEIESVLVRLMAGSPLGEVAEPAGLARAVSAAFVGMELFEGVDPDGAQRALDAVEQLAVLVEVVDGLGPVARRALRATLRRRT
jgi:AcrR family transcriptional regulator